MRIRRRETPFDDRLYRVAKTLPSVSGLVWPAFHSFLYNEWSLRRSVWHGFRRIVYYEPMFNSQCKVVGKNFRMEYAGNGSTNISGNLSVSFGSNVHIFDNTVFVGLKVYDEPELIIGDNTYFGPRVRFMVGKKITVGDFCLINSRIITDNSGHPVDDVMMRLTAGGGSPIKESIRPVSIGNFCFLPMETVVYPWVTIGDVVVARVGTHIN